MGKTTKVHAMATNQRKWILWAGALAAATFLVLWHTTRTMPVARSSDGGNPPVALTTQRPSPPLPPDAGKTQTVPSAQSVWSSSSERASAAAFAQIQSSATSGDTRSQRELAELYERCAIFSLSPSNLYSTLDVFARFRGEPVTVHDNVKRRFADACSGVDRGQVIPTDAYMEWYALAAQHGDAYSMVKLASFNNSTLDDSDYQSIARHVVHSKDPEALFALGDLLALAPDSADLAEFRSLSGPAEYYALGIVACRMGADCGESSYRMDSVCINLGVCGAGNYEDVVRSRLVPADQREALEQAIAAANEIIAR